MNFVEDAQTLLCHLFTSNVPIFWKKRLKRPLTPGAFVAMLSKKPFPGPPHEPLGQPLIHLPHNSRPPQFATMWISTRRRVRRRANINKIIGDCIIDSLGVLGQRVIGVIEPGDAVLLLHLAFYIRKELCILISTLKPRHPATLPLILVCGSSEFRLKFGVFFEIQE